MSNRVSIRTKLVSNNKSKYYLDFYPPIFDRKKGKYTRYETTKYFIYNDFQSETIYYNDAKGKKQSKIEVLKDSKGNPKKLTLTPSQKQHNKEMLELIRIYQGKRLKQVAQSDIYSEAELKQMEMAERSKQIFTEYFKRKAESATKSSGAWLASYKYFEKFYGNVLFEHINKNLIEDFKNKLLNSYGVRVKSKKIKKNTASSYFIRFVQCLEDAYEENYLSYNFKTKVEWIEEEEVMKNFLTHDECIQLFKTHNDNEPLVKYCKFAYLTGLRFSDINNLKWSDVEVRNGITFINFKMQKTKAIQYHPISKESSDLMGESKKADDFVFERIKYAYLNNDLRQWLKQADIKKKVTFHNFRTSYAVTQLESGADIYLISKMLGHKNVSTTEIYAKIVDERKILTIDNIKLGL